MYKLSDKSYDILQHADIRLVRVVFRTLLTYDISVICSYRDEDAQNDAYNNGYSYVQYPNSPHNRKPAFAIDLRPYPYPETFVRECNQEMAAHVLRAAEREEVRLRWGGLFLDAKDRLWIDAAHFELADWRWLDGK